MIIWLMYYSEGVEHCKEWSSNMTQQIDLAFNIFFMVYFFIRVRCSYRTITPAFPQSH